MVTWITRMPRVAWMTGLTCWMTGVTRMTRVTDWDGWNDCDVLNDWDI